MEFYYFHGAFPSGNDFLRKNIFARNPTNVTKIILSTHITTCFMFLLVLILLLKTLKISQQYLVYKLSLKVRPLINHISLYICKLQWYPIKTDGFVWFHIILLNVNHTLFFIQVFIFIIERRPSGITSCFCGYTRKICIDIHTPNSATIIWQKISGSCKYVTFNLSLNLVFHDIQSILSHSPKNDIFHSIHKLYSDLS